MLTDDMEVISVDDHVVEPPGVWTDRLTTADRERGPHIEHGPDHSQLWVWEGRQYPFQLVGSPSSRIFRSDGTGSDFYARHYDDLAPATYDVHARLEAMDADGIHAQLLFPQFPRFAGTRFLEATDHDLALRCVQAYNDWMLDEWCATAPDRFIPCVILPLWDPVLAAAEIERTATKGAKAISFPENPAPLGLPSIWTGHWDPVYAAVQAAEIPLCIHIGTSGALTQPSSESPESVQYSLVALNCMAAATEIVFSGILSRYPGTKIVLSEGSAGWVPYLCERMDYIWERLRADMDRSAPPSEIFKRHLWTCFIKDDVAIALRNHIGVDRMMFETDFPHQDSNWPHSRKVLAEMLTDVDNDDCRRIASGNARQLFNFF